MQITNTLHRIVTRQTSSRPLAVVRIAVGTAALLKGFKMQENLATVADPAVVNVPYFEAYPAVSASTNPWIMAIWFASAVAFLVGWHTRLMGTLLTGVIGFALLLDQQIYGNHVYLLFLLCLLLTVADSGASLSLDARRRGTRESVPEWPQTLLKLQLSIVYLFTALSKVNLSFLSGEVLEEYMGHLPLVWRFPTAAFVPLSVVTLIVEFFLVFALWSRRWRPYAFVAGLGLHATIPFTMPPDGLRDLIVFSIQTLSLYLLFLPAAQASRLVLWDSTCSFCRVWVRWFRRLDWLAVHRFVGSGDPAAFDGTGVTRAEADRAIQVVGPDGRTSGFDGVRTILEALPVSFLWAPLLGLPAVRKLGIRKYREVALRRTCAVSTRVKESR